MADLAAIKARMEELSHRGYNDEIRGLREIIADLLLAEPVHVGWAAAWGAGEIRFRQVGHPKNDAAINAESGMTWHKVFVLNEEE